MAGPFGPGRRLRAGWNVFAGGPNEIARGILSLHHLLGNTRQILQMDVGGMRQATFLKSIELLGTEVLPPNPQELEPDSEPVSVARGSD